MTRSTLVVHVQPGAKLTAVSGRYGDALKIRLAAAPVDGAANKELVRFLAEQLAVAKRDVHITHGLAARRKRVLIEGLDEATVAAKLG